MEVSEVIGAVQSRDYIQGTAGTKNQLETVLATAPEGAPAEAQHLQKHLQQENEGEEGLKVWGKIKKKIGIRVLHLKNGQ